MDTGATVARQLLAPWPIQRHSVAAEAEIRRLPRRRCGRGRATGELRIGAAPSVHHCLASFSDRLSVEGAHIAVNLAQQLDGRQRSDAARREQPQTHHNATNCAMAKDQTTSTTCNPMAFISRRWSDTLGKDTALGNRHAGPRSRRARRCVGHRCGHVALWKRGLRPGGTA